MFYYYLKTHYNLTKKPYKKKNFNSNVLRDLYLYYDYVTQIPKKENNNFNSENQLTFKKLVIQ